MLQMKLKILLIYHLRHNPLFNYSYHQKYMLQHHPWLLESCDINPGKSLIKSHAAARLNGYIGGYGKPADLQTEGVKLGLNEKMIEYVLKQMKSKY